MKIQLLKENFFNATSLVNRFVTTKASLPVLSYIGIRANDDGIFLFGTDLELGVRIRIGGKVISPGEIAVPAKILHDLLQIAPLGPVSLEMVDGGVELKAGKMKAKLSGMGFDEFPVWETALESLESIGEYDASVWQTIWNHLGYSLSSDEARPVLRGVLWELLRGRLVATDGYRLSLYDDEGFVCTTLKGVERLLLPGRFVREMVKSLSELSYGKVQLYLDKAKQQVWARSGEMLVMGRLLEGDYPHYEAIVPGIHGKRVQVENEVLAQAVKAAAIFAKDSAHIVRLEVVDPHVIVRANAPQVGENQVEVEATIKGEGDAMVAFNSRYVLDYLSHAGVSEIVITMTESLKPVLFASPQQKGMRHVVMPVRVRES